MQFKVTTLVKQNPEKVFAGFNKTLFKSLAPPFPKMKLMHFDGCKPGDKVVLELNFIFFKQLWASDVVELIEEKQHITFVDEGRVLPFFLKSWRHIHQIKADSQGSAIVDHVFFEPKVPFTGWLIYPMMLSVFWYRKHIYRKAFSA